MLRLPLLIVWLLCLLATPVRAGLLDRLQGNAEPEFLPVEQAFPVGIDIQGPFLLAQWQSADGYYLYQHRIFLQQGQQRLAPTRFTRDGQPTTGKEKQDEAFGQVTAFYGPLEAEFDLNALQPGTATLNYQGCADAGLCYPPQKLTVEIPVLKAELPLASTVPATTPMTATAADTSPSDSWFANRSWAGTVGLFFLLGLGLTFTPCVLPMVPIMTSVVLGNGQHTSRSRAFMLSSTYVLGMAITYATAGLAVGLLGAGANLQAWMQTPWVLILFSLLFVVLALAMFDVYELQLPAPLRNRLNQISQNQQGGQWLGVLVIGILSALVVSPCVSAPLAGALVYIGSTGDAWLGGSALLALGLGMGTPLILLATSGASLLPKAGAWMTQVRNFFGVMLLAVAIWLLGRLLPGYISLALWAVLCLIYALVLGALEPAQSSSQRLIKGLAWVLLIYGAATLVGALQGNSNPLQPLAFGQSSSRPEFQAPFARTASVDEVRRQLATSQQPVMLDLYADWCISCKVMDDEVFSRPEVRQALAGWQWLQLDITDQTPEQVQFLKDMAVFGPPTILFFHNHQELANARITGEMTLSGFLTHLQRQNISAAKP